jgi:hypothetical protein
VTANISSQTRPQTTDDPIPTGFSRLELEVLPFFMEKF